MRHRHGLSKSPEYSSWKNMLGRCYTSSTNNFKYYGGRGIGVCKEWRASFVAFLDDVGKMPSPGMTLDRIDSDGNYEPGNVRWATWKQQFENRRRRTRPRTSRVPRIKTVHYNALVPEDHLQALRKLMPGICPAYHIRRAIEEYLERTK